MKVDKLVAIVVLVWCTERQGWDPRGLASTSRTPRGQNFVALALASTMCGLGFGFEEIWP